MENNKLEIVTLVNQKALLQQQLSALVFGSIEIRDVKGGKYIYLHSRMNGIVRTSYVGEYTDDLYNRILKNNIEAKALKKQIREADKKLKTLGYEPSDLSDKIRTNIDFAKRNIVDIIYKQAILEGVAVTFLDTETIIEGGKINNLSADDILKINNLKHAWQFILDKDVISSKSDFYLLCTINKLVEEGFYYNAGQLRSVPVSIGGTNWKLQLPIESIVKEELTNILSINNVYGKAVNALLYIMKKQIFIDGNKRSAVIFANHILISNGAGLIVIPDSEVSEYKKLLIEYYETDNSDNIIKFLIENCLTKL